MKTSLFLLIFGLTTLLCKGQNNFNQTQAQIAQQFAAYGDKSYTVQILDDGKTYMMYDNPGISSIIFRFDFNGKCEAIIRTYQLHELFIADLAADMKKYVYNSSTGKLQDASGAYAEYDQKNKIIFHFRPRN